MYIILSDSYQNDNASKEVQCEETDNDNKKQNNKKIEFNKNRADFKNLKSSENSKKCTENENNNNDKEFKNVSYSTQVQS